MLRAAFDGFRELGRSTLREAATLGTSYNDVIIRRGWMGTRLALFCNPSAHSPPLAPLLHKELLYVNYRNATFPSSPSATYDTPPHSLRPNRAPSSCLLQKGKSG
ncbi:MAG: hypothetical protein SV062_12400 [Thermodesulfobacteriota bacterium]|nr:hypothetical protein [Thermodesulfobacteriota bacterium]